MSYGRSPYLIIGTRGHDGDVIEFMMPMGSISRDEFPYPHGRQSSYAVPEDAIAQFIAHLAARGTEELQSWIDRGAALDDDYTGFYVNHPSKDVRKDAKSQRRWLKTKVTVKRRGRKLK